MPQRLLQRLRDVVHVVGDSAQQLAARLGVEVAQRQLVELGAHLVSHPVDGALHRPVEQEVLQEAEQRGGHVQPQRQQQPASQQVEVDALPGDDVQTAQHVGELALAPCPQHLDDLLLGHTGRQLASDHAVEDDVGRLAQYLRANHRGDHRDGPHSDDHGEQHPFGTQHAHQPTQRGAEVDRLLGHVLRHRSVTHSGGALSGTLRRRRLLFRAVRLGDQRFASAHAAASSMLRWDSTISR